MSKVLRDAVLGIQTVHKHTSGKMTFRPQRNMWAIWSPHLQQSALNRLKPTHPHTKRFISYPGRQEARVKVQMRMVGKELPLGRAYTLENQTEVEKNQTDSCTEWSIKYNISCVPVEEGKAKQDEMTY